MSEDRSVSNQRYADRASGLGSGRAGGGMGRAPAHRGHEVQEAGHGALVLGVMPGRVRSRRARNEGAFVGTDSAPLGSSLHSELKEIHHSPSWVALLV